MQGRLSLKEFNKIQSFPIDNWKNEFAIANLMNLKKLEWTIDYDYFFKNPLMNKNYHKEIKDLKKFYKIDIESVTCDFLMNKPFWKIKNNQKLIHDFEFFLNNCIKLSIKKIIITKLFRKYLSDRFWLNIKGVIIFINSFFIK